MLETLVEEEQPYEGSAMKARRSKQAAPLDCTLRTSQKGTHPKYRAYS